MNKLYDNALILAVGVSGSGKSTYAKKWQESNLDKRSIVSTDEIRQELLGDASDQSNGKMIFETAYNMINKRLQAGYNVYFDATNLTRRSRKELIKRFSAYHIYALVFVTDLEEACQRQELRERKVPRGVIRRQLVMFTYPTEDEGFDAVVDYDRKYQPYKFFNRKEK